MARVTHVKKAQKDQGSCIKCGTPIKRGDSYKWFSSRIGRSSIRKNFCSNCQIQQSDRTSSPNLQTLYLALEGAENDLGNMQESSLGEIAAILETAAEGVQDASDGYTESADNMVDGFGHETYQSEEIREKAEALESFASELRDAASEVEGSEDPDESDAEIAENLGLERINDDDAEEPEFDDEDTDAIVQERERRLAEAVDLAENALMNVPL